MNLKNLLSMLALGIACNATAQYQLAFEKNYSTNGPSAEGEDLVELPGGNILIAATRSVPIGGGVFQANVQLLKLRPDGDTIWTREFGATTSREYAESMILMPDGRVAIAGYITDIPNGAADVLVMVADTNGNLQWQKRIGSMTDEFANAIRQTPDGFIVGGVTHNSLIGSGDAWLLKLDQNGDSLWSKTFGGPLYDDCWDITLTPENGFMMTGGNYSFAAGDYDDAWIIKTDSLGNQIWMKNYGLTDRVDWAWSITPAITNGQLTGYVFVGIKDTEEDPPGAAYSSLHFVKVDTAGVVLWDKSFTQAGGYRIDGRDVRQTSDGGFLIGGYNMSPSVNGTAYYLLKTDSLGNKIWDTSISQNGSAYTVKSVLPASDGSFFLTGSVATSTPTQFMFVSKFKPAVNSIREHLTISDLALAPNPASGVVTLSGDLKGQSATVLILNVAGKLVHKESLAPAHKFRHRLVLPNEVAPGAYTVTVVTDSGSKTLRLIVQ